MSRSLTIHHEDRVNPKDIKIPDSHQDPFSKTIFGFWIYLMSDCLIFATLFSAYAVLHSETFHGPTSKDLFSLKDAFIETMILLFSSVTCGFAILSSLKQKNKAKVIGFLALTFLLGISFVAFELNEFHHLIKENASWERSAFLSGFFTLVSTHGLHVSFGLLWCMTMIFQVYFKGINVTTFRRLVTFSMFWHFLDLVWIFIFTFVYLMGVL